MTNNQSKSSAEHLENLKKEEMHEALSLLDDRTFDQLTHLMDEVGMPLEPSIDQLPIDHLPTESVKQLRRSSTLTRVLMFLVLFCSSSVLNACMPNKGSGVKTSASTKPPIAINIASEIAKIMSKLGGNASDTVCRYGSDPMPEIRKELKSRAKKAGMKHYKASSSIQSFSGSQLACARVHQFSNAGRSTLHGPTTPTSNASSSTQKTALSANGAIDSRQHELGGDYQSKLYHKEKLSDREVQLQNRATTSINRTFLQPSFWNASIPHGASAEENKQIMTNIEDALENFLKNKNLFHYQEKSGKIIIQPRRLKGASSSALKIGQLELDKAGALTKLTLADGQVYQLQSPANWRSSWLHRQARMQRLLMSISKREKYLEEKRTENRGLKVLNAARRLRGQPSYMLVTKTPFNIIKSNDRQFLQETMFMQTPHRLFWLLRGRYGDGSSLPEGAVKTLYEGLKDIDGDDHPFTMNQLDPSEKWKKPVEGKFNPYAGLTYSLKRDANKKSIHYTPNFVYMVVKNGVVIGAFHADGSVMEQVKKGPNKGWTKKAD